MKVKLILITLNLLSFGLLAQVEIEGTVSTTDGKPISSVTVKNKVTGSVWYSGTEGIFLINAAATDTVTFERLGYQSVRTTGELLKLKPSLRMVEEEKQIEAVNVVYTGFQKLSKEQMTGSVDVIGEDLLQRSNSSSILERIENLTPGIQFQKGEAAETDPFLIRGRSTITASSAPLIVVDDFPYEGNIDDINPNDVASISILKDAAAASIWGARAGNGVIVIKTKQGVQDRKQVNVKTDFLLESQPDLSSLQWIDASDLIEFEKRRFEDGAYDDVWNGPYYITPITPVVDHLFTIREHPERRNELLGEIEKLKNRDVRDDISKYLYRAGQQQQLHVDVSGGSKGFDYMASVGHSNRNQVLEGSGRKRTSLRINNSYRPTENLHLTHALQYVDLRDYSNANPGYRISGNRPIYPYASLVDESGNPTSQYLYYPKQYLDTLGQEQLLDWTFNPTRDLETERNAQVENSLTANVSLTWNPLNGLRISGRYQYQQNRGEIVADRSSDAYYVRSMVNQYSYFQNGQIRRPIPVGGILDMTNLRSYSHQARAQMDYSKNWRDVYGIDAIAGYEIRSRIDQRSATRYYGYEGERMSVVPAIDYMSTYVSLISGAQLKIPPIANMYKSSDNFISLYSNILLSYKKQLYLNASVRKDEANLFGVEANAKGTPFWSTGLRWEITETGWELPRFLNRLALRTTYGVSGNVSRAASAATTINYVLYASTGLPSAILNSPPNKNLRWERIETWNIGMDFSLFHDRISGYIDYYIKGGKDLLSEAPVDPTLGTSIFYGNVAEMNGNGVELFLTTHNTTGRLKWTTTGNFSYTSSKVKKYLMPTSGSATPYLSGITIAPIVGRPLYSIYSYESATLDPATGDPQGYLNDEISKDYRSIIAETEIEELTFHGPLQSPIYGALRNEFAYGDMALSFNISYKLGGYFRTQSLSSYNLLLGFNAHRDYTNRWKAPGDENTTHIPSVSLTHDPDREYFYRYSDRLVMRSDNIRLEDVIISYRFNPVSNALKWIQSGRLFAQVQNINLAWLANNKKIDPYFNNIPKTGATYTLGLHLTL